MIWENIYGLIINEKEQKSKLYTQRGLIFRKNELHITPAQCSELLVIGCYTLKYLQTFRSVRIAQGYIHILPTVQQLKTIDPTSAVRPAPF